MDLSRFFALLSRWRRFVIAGTILAAAAGWGVSLLIPPAYESRAVVLVGSALSSVTVDTEQMDVSRRLTETYAEVATSRPLLQRVAANIGLENRLPEISITPVRDPPVIRVIAVGDTPEQAAAVANAVVTELIILSPGHGDREEESRQFITRQLIAIEDEIDTVGAEIDALIGVSSRTPLQEQRLTSHRARLLTLQSNYASLLSASSRRGSNLLTVVEEAVPNAAPVSPRPAQNTLLAGLVGLVLTMAALLIRERFAETLRSAEEVERALGLPVLGAIPRLATTGPGSPALLLMSAEPNPRAAEGIRSLQANVTLLAGDSLRSLLVTSSSVGEGRTTVAVNLAIAFARAGRRVVLIDADLEHPSIHRHFRTYHRYGLSDFLRADGLEPSDLTRGTEVDGLQFLPAGNVGSSHLELVGSPRMGGLVRSLADAGELVIVDGPAVIGVSEASVLATFVDASLLVVKAGHTRRPSLEASRDALINVGATLMGSVLNDVPAWHASPDPFARTRAQSPREVPSLREGPTRS